MTRRPRDTGPFAVFLTASLIALLCAACAAGTEELAGVKYHLSSDDLNALGESREVNSGKWTLIVNSPQVIDENRQYLALPTVWTNTTDRDRSLTDDSLRDGNHIGRGIKPIRMDSIVLAAAVRGSEDVSGVEVEATHQLVSVECPADLRDYDAARLMEKFEWTSKRKPKSRVAPDSGRQVLTCWYTDDPIAELSYFAIIERPALRFEPDEADYEHWYVTTDVEPPSHSLPDLTKTQER